MKRCVSLLLAIAFLFVIVAPSSIIANAEGNELLVVEENNKTYKIYNESGDLIAEKQNVYVDDSILTTDFVKYKIIQIDDDNNVAFAEFEERLRKPDVSVEYVPNRISQDNPTLCLYMTHNDESYVTGDGYDSIYGKGGIHDIAKLLKLNFEKLGITTHIDETLHIPHDSYAYSRSSATAKKLLSNYTPDAIFDIHRDGASRSTYVKKVGGVERCKVRIVVGKASSNFKIAEQFALYLMSVASEVCDWLFLDIYYASGHYNQGLYSKALLFEMGSHLVEKDLVEQSVPELAKVVKTALFNTTVDTSSGDLTINGNADASLPTISENQNSSNTSANPTVNEVLEDMQENNSIDKTAPTIAYFVVLVVGAGIVAGLTLSFIKKRPKVKKRTK